MPYLFDVRCTSPAGTIHLYHFHITFCTISSSTHQEEGEVEIRQVFEADDFGEAFTPALREQEERIRTEAERRQR
jgi:hypothetical protein